MLITHNKIYLYLRNYKYKDSKNSRCSFQYICTQVIDCYKVSLGTIHKVLKIERFKLYVRRLVQEDYFITSVEFYEAIPAMVNDNDDILKMVIWTNYM